MIPGAPFDLVYARLLLYHLPERVAVLRRLWDAVSPGGHLLVQDYDLRSVGTLPSLESVDELGRVVIDAFAAAGCDVHVGARLPELFARAGIGAPDGTDVSGRLEPLVDAQQDARRGLQGSAADRDRAGHHDGGAFRRVAVGPGGRRRAVSRRDRAVAVADRRLEAQAGRGAARAHEPDRPDSRVR